MHTMLLLAYTICTVDSIWFLTVQLEISWYINVVLIFFAILIFLIFAGERTTCVACTSNLPELTPYVRNFVAEKMLISLQIPCEFTKNGYEKSLDPGTMEDHKKECEFRTIDCIMHTCSGRIVIHYRGLTKHLARNHEFDIFKLVLSS